MLIMTTKVDKRKLIIAAAAVVAAIVMLLTLGGGASEPTASLSTAPAADTNDARVLMEGRIVERGKHEELLQLNGVYKRLNDMQSLA